MSRAAHAVAQPGRTCRSSPGQPNARTMMRYDRASKNLDRHPNYIVAAYMASGT